MIFFASKKSGELIFESPERFKKYLESLPDCRIAVNVNRYRPARSPDQNNLWHGICQIIAQETGHTLEEVKNGIKIEAGLYTKRTVPLLVSSARLNKQEFSVLIEHTYVVAARLGIILPSAEEWKAMQ